MTLVLASGPERAGIYHGARTTGARCRADFARGDMRDGAVAIVERHDGFYELFSGGELRGPVSPGKQGDLPVLSGAALPTAGARICVDYAAALVRAEDATVGNDLGDARRDDGTASLFLERARTEVVIDLDRAPTKFSARSKCGSNGRDART